MSMTVVTPKRGASSSEPLMPATCTCESIRPGSRTPLASVTGTPRGIDSPLPSAAILPCSTRTVSSVDSRSPVKTRAPRMAKEFPFVAGRLVQPLVAATRPATSTARRRMDIDSHLTTTKILTGCCAGQCAGSEVLQQTSEPAARCPASRGGTEGRGPDRRFRWSGARPR